MNVRFEPGLPLHGTVRPPADKSISHRAAIMAAMGQGACRIDNFLWADDTRSTLGACAALGAGVELDGSAERTVTVTGVGLHGPRPGVGPIDVGNAGTLMRLLPGWLAAQPGQQHQFDGDASIRRRPVDRIAEPLRMMGAQIEAREGRLPPFTVHGAELRPIDYTLPVASAQVKSCVLLAAIGGGGASVIEPVSSRDHTERLLLRAGVELEHSPGGAGDSTVTTVRRAGRLTLERIEVPADLSSAAFLIAAALLIPGSRVRLSGVGVNWTRTGFLRVAARMGAQVDGELEVPGAFGPGDPVSDLEISASELTGTVVQPHEVPLTIDELPLVALLGCYAGGETVVEGAQELRLKESDRVDTVVEGLRGLGGDLEATADGFVVRGTGGLRGGVLASHGDHRLALLGAVAGLASRDGVQVRGMEAARVSYPDFAADLTALGARGRGWS